jgi:hypothetical protein
MSNIKGTLTRSALSLSDPSCQVLMSRTHIFRAICADSIETTQKLIDSGLLNELHNRNLIPRTQIAAINMPGFNLVLKQARIDPVIYPYEWSPEMLRHAALCMLDVNQCANAFGYELKDAQPFNIVFHPKHPFFVDIGSFVQQRTPHYWGAREEFDACFCQVLRLAQKGCLSLYKHAFLLQGAGYSKPELMALSHPVAKKVFGLQTFRFFALIASMYRIGPTIDERAINSRFRNFAVRACVKFILQSKVLPFRSFRHSRLMRQVERYKLKGKSDWGDYHRQAGLCGAGGEPQLSARMNWVVSTARSLSPKSILELAGNQGVLSQALSRALPADTRIICNDYDPYAVDQLYRRLHPRDKVFPACFDFMRDARESITQERSQRLRSDLVVALAVTHHLVLTQSFSLDAVFFTFHSYTEKHLIVEFMPLGLWDGTRPASVPEWYHEAGFVSHMERYFQVLSRIQLEKNRVLFVGERKPHLPPMLDNGLAAHTGCRPVRGNLCDRDAQSRSPEAHVKP